MNPIEFYQRQSTFGWTRIDLLLALFEKTISQIKAGLHSSEIGATSHAEKLFLQAALRVNGLAAGMSGEQSALTDNLLRLYEFVHFALLSGDVSKITASVEVLRKLQEGYSAIRPEGAALERNGAIPSVESAQTIQTVA